MYKRQDKYGIHHHYEKDAFADIYPRRGGTVTSVRSAQVTDEDGKMCIRDRALMATLTVGLSAGITGIIVLWDKYSDAQEKAAEKAKERVKIESDGRAQMDWDG